MIAKKVAHIGTVVRGLVCGVYSFVDGAAAGHASKMPLPSFMRCVAVFAIFAGSSSAAGNEAPRNHLVEQSQHQKVIEPLAISKLFGERVNPQSLALSFEHTDVELPGHGPRVAITRTFDVWARQDLWEHGTREFRDWDLEVPSLVVVLPKNEYWYVLQQNPPQQANPNWSGQGHTPRCSGFSKPPNVKGDYNGTVYTHYASDWFRGVRLSVPGQGVEHLLLRDPSSSVALPPIEVSPGVSSSFPITTKSNWHFACLPAIANGAGEGFLGVSPTGEKYWFNWMAVRRDLVALNEAELKLGMVEVRLYATRVEDRFGNRVDYAYDNKYLKSIKASDGRELRVDWLEGSNGYSSYRYISRVVAQPGTEHERAWTYQYRTFSWQWPIYPHYNYALATLTSLTLPDNSSWRFDFAGLSRTCLPNPDPEGNVGCYPDYSQGGGVGSVTAPSGATMTYSLRYDQVPDRSLDHLGLSETQLRQYPAAYEWFFWDQAREVHAATLAGKKLSGPGLSGEWTYSTERDVCSQWFCYTPGKWVNEAGKGSAVRVERHPGGLVVRRFVNNEWRSALEAMVTEESIFDSSNLDAPLRRTLYTYSPSEMPQRIGLSFAAHAGLDAIEKRQALITRAVHQDGAVFTSRASDFDHFGRPRKVQNSSSLGFSSADEFEYFDSVAPLVIGQVKSQRNAETSHVLVRTDYDGATALPVRTYADGQLQREFSYYADGNLRTVKDGRGGTTTLAGWKRGIPQGVVFPGGAQMSAVVSNEGLVDSETNEAGYSASYKYDAMGRLSKRDHPRDDSVVWNADESVFEPVAVDEYGLPAGHWRQTMSTGNARKVSYFDGLWRPVLVREYDTADVAGTQRFTRYAYDHEGRVTFASYPGTNSNLTEGVWTEYDALGRVTSVSQDSEHGLLTTRTEYLPGFQTRVTNPRNQWTTTSFMALDQPSYDWPVLIRDSAGRETQIVRDVFGKPRELIRRQVGH